ncbi:MAG: Uma2 family endonuclease [Bacteroidetes bacterium]|nr:MAG: Uma2 family endonuclease [Bacteroidota bacterium]
MALEYYQGKIIPKTDSEPLFVLDLAVIKQHLHQIALMTSKKHSKISTELIGVFNNFTQENENYEVFDSNLMVFLEALESYVYPDMTVAHSQNQIFVGEMLKNPLMVAEVLSDSTEKKDRTLKKDAYLACDSLQDYLMIEQNFLQVIHYFRLENVWQSSTYQSIDDQIIFAGIPFVLDLKKIYRRVL